MLDGTEVIDSAGRPRLHPMRRISLQTESPRPAMRRESCSQIGDLLGSARLGAPEGDRPGMPPTGHVSPNPQQRRNPK
jgi:hypothetical protein